MRGDHYDLSCSLYEVSQASYTQDESITPRISKLLGKNNF